MCTAKTCGSKRQRHGFATATQREAEAHLQQEGANPSVKRLVELSLAHVHLQYHYQRADLLRQSSCEGPGLEGLETSVSDPCARAESLKYCRFGLEATHA